MQQSSMHASQYILGIIIHILLLKLKYNNRKIDCEGQKVQSFADSAEDQKPYPTKKLTFKFFFFLEKLQSSKISQNCIQSIISR